MQTLVGLLLLLLIAFVGSHSLRSRWNPPPSIRRLFDSGLVFLLLGVAIGPNGLDWISDEALDRTGPLIVFGLGWIGLLYGAHLEWRRLRRAAARLWAAAFGQSIITFALVLNGSWFFLARYFPDVYSPVLFAAAVTLAACAAGTAPSTVFQLAGRPGLTRPVARTMRIITSVDDVPGLIAFGLLLAFFPAATPGSPHWQAGLALAGLTVGVGVLFGLLLKTLLVEARDEQVTLLVLLGVAGLAAGLAAMLQLSSIFVGLVAGVTFVNSSAKKEGVFALLAASEHTIYVLFLVLVGCHWTFRVQHLLPLAAVYLAARTVGKVLGGAAAHAVLGGPGGRIWLSGFALLPQGGIAVALVVNYQHVYPSGVTPLIMTVLIVGLLANELLGSRLADIPFGRSAPRNEGGS